VTRALWSLVAASLGVALLATLWFVVGTIGVRIPYWGEAEVIYEAARIRAHQPLFIDPIVGTTDVPPSHYFVTYPPLYTWVVSFLPEGKALVGSRVLCTLAWFGSLGAVAWRSRRIEVAGAATFVAGIWVLANFAMLGRPDSIAGAVAVLALWRATDGRARLDPLTVALFVLVPWIKPTMIGLPVGALLASKDRRAWAMALGFAVVSAAMAGKALFVHVVQSNAQPFALSAWLEQVPARLPFFAPLFAWAFVLGKKERIALGAFLGAFAWTLVALAKTGSSSNYWMEPCLAAVVLLARAPRANYGDYRVAGVALVSVLYADVASVRGAIEHRASFRNDAEVVSSMRAECMRSPEDVVAADEAGIELVLDGRILMPAYQMTYLAAKGAIPESLFRDELGVARCYVEHTGQLELLPSVASELPRLFEGPIERDGFRLWKKGRGSASTQTP
jgi:hypothetical protein